MSITTAPFFIQSPRTMFAIPTSVTIMSASDVICSGFFVYACNKLTVAWCLYSKDGKSEPYSNWNIFFSILSNNIFFVTCNSNEVGNPAILLLPIIATLFPLISTPCLSNNSMQLFEAQGIKKGFLPRIARFPIFKGWNPSTSFSGRITFIILSSSRCCIKCFRNITYSLHRSKSPINAKKLNLMSTNFLILLKWQTLDQFESW